MKTTMETIVHYVGTILGVDISNELDNKSRLVLDAPEYSQETKDLHKVKSQARDETFKTMQALKKAACEEYQKTIDKKDLDSVKARIMKGEVECEMKPQPRSTRSHLHSSWKAQRRK